MLIAAADSGIDIYDWKATRLVRQIRYPGPVNSLVLHLDGKHLATVKSNGTVYLLRVPEFEEDHITGKTRLAARQSETASCHN